jgi:hypothetical protein
VAEREGGALSLREAAVRVGAYRWVERRLFELTGSWAAAPGLPDGPRLLLFEASAQHAWHAELWEARLPVLPGVDPELLTRPVGRTVEPLLAGLSPGAFDGDAETAGRRFLVGLARAVLPLLLVSYRRFGQRLVPVADGPAIRALTLVVRDENEEQGALEEAVDPLLDSRERAQQAAVWLRALGAPVSAGAAQDVLLPWSDVDFPDEAIFGGGPT